MEELVKKLEQLKNLIKAVKIQTAVKQVGPQLPKLPTPKAPVAPSMTPSTAQAPKIGIGNGPNSKKDPKKVAEQIKNGSMSTKTQKTLLKADTGQWSSDDLDKADKEADLKLYHIHDGPHRITSEPVSLSQIKAQHGGVQKLENSGMRLIAHTPKPVEKAYLESDELLAPTDSSNI